MSDFSDSDSEEPGREQLEFSQAADHVQQIHTSLPQNELLTLYGLYKQATCGACDTAKPGIFSLQGRAKWCAWNDLKAMPRREAMQVYVQKVQALDPTWKPSAATGEKPPSSAIGWVVHSIPQIPAENLVEKAEHEKTAFDYVKEHNLLGLRQLNVDGAQLQELDENGMGLLHWATDRDCVDIVKYLLGLPGIDVNVRDSDGQTALHYAASCGHVESVRLLLAAGGDRTARDADGQSCGEVAENTEILSLLAS